jgi:radical SAM-linked protein
MQISFENALPVGMESEEEILWIYFENGTAPDTIVDALNKELPQGLFITGCRPFRRSRNENEKSARYRVLLTEGNFDKDEVERFSRLSEFMVQDLSKKGKTRTTDLRKSVEKISYINLHTLEMILKPYNERTVRPMEILTNCFKPEEKALAAIRITKMKQQK